MPDWRRIRGLKDLVRDAVQHGSRAIERTHLGTSERTFQVLERIPPLARPSELVHGVHDAIVTTSHLAVRGVTQVVSVGLDLALDAAESLDAPEAPSELDAE
ncbi:MAG: hypothetical protein AB7N76_18890 [Planctomycetota bacterium]